MWISTPMARIPRTDLSIICKTITRCIRESCPSLSHVLRMEAFDWSTVLDIQSSTMVHFTMLSIVVLEGLDLLHRHLAILEVAHAAGLDPGLPGRSANVRNAIGVLEHFLGLLQGLARSFREAEEDVEEHGNVEDTEDQIDLPSNVLERRRNKCAESGIERPVGGGGEGDTFTANAKRVQFGWLHNR